jgi:hypothetical protein
MPINLPHRDPDTGDLVNVRHYDTAEVSAMFHVSEAWVRRQCGGPDPAWPHLRMANRIWFSDDDVDRILELATHDPDAIPREYVPRLGTPLTDTDLEGVR